MSTFEKPFYSIFTKIKEWLQHSGGEFYISGISPDEWFFLVQNYGLEYIGAQHQLFVCSTQDKAEELFDSMPANSHYLFYPGLGHSPYGGIITSDGNLLQRINVLRKIKTSSTPLKIIAPIEAIHLYVADHNFLFNQEIILNQDDIIAPIKLAELCQGLGYHAASTVEEPGTFSRKGEVFDIYPINDGPIRIIYFDDLIESIFPIDLETQKSIREKKISQVIIKASTGFLANEKSGQKLRQILTAPPAHYKYRTESRNKMLQALNNNQLFENFPLYFPTLFDKPLSLVELFPENGIIHFLQSRDTQQEWDLIKEQWSEQKDQQDQVDSSVMTPAISNFLNINAKVKQKKLHIDKLKFHSSENFSQSIDATFQPVKNMIYKNPEDERGKSILQKLLSGIIKEMSDSGILHLAYRNESTQNEVIHHLESLDFPLSRFSSKCFFLKEGFVYPQENIVILSEADLYGKKIKKVKAQKNSQQQDLFAEQISTLVTGDYLIHRDHGVGQYIGMESIQVGDKRSDFLTLLYEGGDKVYVPVYRLNLVQKYAGESSGAKVASLKSKKFLEAKKRARESVKKLAFNLLKLQAERKLKGGFAFSAPEQLYKDFELSFPFEETPDQEKAINDIINDMENSQAMDRLVCGDVGFGKTEVAMRAAFKAVEDKKQVAVLVPTTVLCLQHFHSFIKRFQNFPVNINFISRLRTATETKQIFNELKEGKIDIIIGTHKILSGDLEFKDLGLIIIDEEHRFGVNHKEKLKSIKSGVDVLTLTATPIPRTLQLSFLGLRDFSLIQTAPPRRQAIKTYLLIRDDQTIKEAIELELSRGGQIFYVHNRVNDIEEVELYLKKLIPKIRITITHGQMNERELEKRIEAFYNHQSDLLLTTTIIESGIDIPNANTMIVDRADNFGLAQLHQLRGRIGRSDRKAYAYFLLPPHRQLSDLAQKRLHALEAYSEIGSGFNLASSDLEIRGAGDILGAEQSGHIDAIGLELYLELLQEAIHEIKGEAPVIRKNCEMQVPFPAYIPNNYIEDQGLRLKYYKKLAHSETEEQVKGLENEMIDIFGLLPKECEALISLIKSRNLVSQLGVSLVKVGQNQIMLSFDQDFLKNNHQSRDKIFEFFMGKPKLYKLNPDSSVNCFFKETVSHDLLYEYSKHIAGQILVC